MLESLINFEEINEKPYLIFLWAFLLTSVAVIVSNHIAFRISTGGVTFNLTGLFAVFFTLIPAIFFVTLMINREERMEERMIRKHYTKGFWERHEKDTIILLVFFAGTTFAFSLWTLMLGPDAFQIQADTINRIRGGISGSFTEDMTAFQSIALNNLQVMLFSFFFSFMFGAGAIFIIIWNASVLGVFIGQLSQSVAHIPLVSLNFLPHGIPEIAAYLVAGLAGGLLSAAIIRKNSAEVLNIVAADNLKLLLVGIALVFLAAGVEVFL
jgi:stage II sporulation protein M